MAETPPGETPPVEPPKNAAPAPVAPNPITAVEDKKTEDGELDKLRKEKEQAEMRANQLANQLKAKEDAEAEATAKELADKEEYKTLFEQEKAKREEAEAERAAEKKAQATKEASQTILAGYSDDVKALAEDAELSLTDDSDEAVAAFKAKLDKFQERIGAPKVTPNNPGTTSTTTEPTGEELREILADPVKRDAYYRQKDGVTAMMMEPPKA